MPTYVYRCQQCGTVLERRQSFEDSPLTECEVCSGQLRRVIQPVQVIFKGPGFYSTDYRAKNPTEAEPKPAATNGETKSASADSVEKSTTPAQTEAAATTATTSASESGSGKP